MPAIFINQRMQPYSYLKSTLELGNNSKLKFDVLNAHVVNAVVLPGELIIVGDNSTPSCTAEEAFYMKKAYEVHLVLMTDGMQGDGFLVDNHALLTKMLGYSSIGIGSIGGAWSKHLDGIKQSLEDIEAAHRDHLKSGTSKTRDSFYAKRAVLFEKLDDQLKGFARYGSGLRNQGSIKNMLGISTKSYLHSGVIAGYAETINGVAKASRLMKKGTYLGIGLSVAATGTSIYTACTTGRETQCRKAKYVEGGKLSGSLAFGTVGGSAGAGIAMFGCAVALGTVTGGPGALACAVIGGGVGGYYGGEIGGKVGESGGEVIYEFLPK
ncbi:hypothetical protein M5G20_02290 [Pseudomonas sp. TNT2022 ID1044]|uniref:hypothetical protein n=1 Tax=Pseudomonas sp. TNT2022 ID1044 TaxID=2942636 RepID=UPI0023628CDC|nr:hypothetical protein [Pseudomonas sp. TNT2022 ID1044]MDD0994693.1 hypothetical protein [Pseudomonas sp. TNT2022 ID1044]